MAALSARLKKLSLGRLELCEVSGYGRCLRCVEKVAAGTVLATEKPVVLGSSDGLCLAKICVGDLDAAEDLIAACILLESRNDGDAQEARAVASELDASADGQLDDLLAYLSSDALEALQQRTKDSCSATLQKWRGVCDVNAETWAEFVEGPSANGNVRFLFGLFGALAMAEHSCQPNARVEWDGAERAMKLVSTVDIQAGQRVSRSYLDVVPLLSPASVRQEALQQDWRFRCECQRCRDEMSGVEPFKGNDSRAMGFQSCDLQRCVDTGLPLDDALKEAVRGAASACDTLGLPAVGTLHFLQGILAKDPELPMLRVHRPSSEASPKRCKVE